MSDPSTPLQRTEFAARESVNFYFLSGYVIYSITSQLGLPSPVNGLATFWFCAAGFWLTTCSLLSSFFPVFCFCCMSPIWIKAKFLTNFDKPSFESKLCSLLQEGQVMIPLIPSPLSLYRPSRHVSQKLCPHRSIRGTHADEFQSLRQTAHSIINYYKVAVWRRR